MKSYILLFGLILSCLSIVVSQDTQLILEGALQIGNTTQATPSDGTIRWSGTDLEVWKDGAWVSLTAGTTTPPPGSLTDIDGNTYNTVTIGSQEWMAENLRTTKYRDGTDIPLVTDQGTWTGLSTGAFCWYNNDPGFENTYGKLYNWHTVDDPKGLCPAGWHVPSRVEWATMIASIGGTTTGGGQLKDTGLALWDSPNEGATNTTGFTALPAGYRSAAFTQEGRFAEIWSREPSGSSAYFQYLSFNSIEVLESSANKYSGLSVRCTKD